MIPKPDHAIKVSCYFDDSERYGDFSADVSSFTNTHYAWAFRYAKDSTTPSLVWIKGLVESCQRAYEAKRSIHVNLNLQQDGVAATPLQEFLKRLTPFWSHVSCLEMADEPRWTKVAVTGTILPTALVRRESTAATAAKVRATVKSLGLSQRDLSVVYSTAQFPGAPIDSLDIVGIEAYCDLPGDPTSARNVQWLTKYLARSIKAVPLSKRIHLVPMAYSRNYEWLDIGNLRKGSLAYRNVIQTLVDIIAVPYAFAKDNPRVVGLNFFSWARASGSREYLRLATQVKALGAAACSGR